MASRRTGTRTSGQGSDIVVVNAAPVARRSSGGGIRRRRRSSGGGKRRRSSKGGAGAGIQSRIQRAGMGGLGYGLIKKNFGSSIPKLIPGLGTSGTVAAIIYFLKPSSTLLQDVGVAAAAIAGASFGETGTVSGDDDEVLQG